VSASDQRCTTGCLSGDSEIETVDGPVAIAQLVGKSMPVFTRVAGSLGFRLMTKIALTATGVPVVRVELDNGRSLVVDRGHVFYGVGMVERPVEQLAVGELLETLYHFPAGYEFRCQDGSTAVSAGSLRVAAVTDAGTADVFTGLVNETQSFFATAGVLCKA
jgi:hypothetical protein